MRLAPPREVFQAAGFRRREAFPHRVVWVPKAYPDSHLQLERRGIPATSIASARFWQLNLYALEVDDVPSTLFTDGAINWHRQTLGLAGMVASAGLCIVDGELVVMLLQSDLVQQASRSPLPIEHGVRSLLDRRFGRWYVPLFNAVLDFADANGFARVLSPTADGIIEGAHHLNDPALFRRIYDSVAERYVVERVRVGRADHLAIPLEANRGRIVPLEDEPPAAAPAAAAGPTICLVHDIEEDVDTEVSVAACRANLEAMLRVQRRLGVRVTYSVLGTLFAAKRPLVAADGHALAFHSYDHADGDEDQLRRCRRVDQQVHGYRPARSRATAELSDANLARHNFEWYLSSAIQLGFTEPRLANGIVRVPIHVDDFPWWDGRLDSAGWLAHIRDLAATRSFVAIGLHDCYADLWIDRYEALLRELASVGTLRTVDEVVDSVYLDAASGSSTRPPATLEAVVS